MRKDIADKLVDRLRNGGIKQCPGSLAINDARCCLGVLCDIAAEENPGIFYWGDPKNSYEESDATLFGTAVEGAKSFGDKDGLRSRCVLPKCVVQWAGCRSATGELWNSHSDKLTSLNDNGTTFPEIADIIEREWENL